MSHELRTPLNAIIGMTSLLLADREALAPDHRDFVETIRDGGDRLVLMIDDVLALAQLTAEPSAPTERAFALRACIESAVEQAAVAAADEGLALACSIDAEAPGVVVGDDARLQQVLRRLLDNAVKFTRRGQIALSVTAERAEAACALRFAVTDTGIGIPPERIRVIFDAFTQADTSATRAYGGAGVGLAICKHLVKLMGGALRVDSQVDVGSAFHFTLRLRAPADSAPADSTAADSTPPAPGSPSPSA
jgi:signal transduction histidine kinase